MQLLRLLVNGSYMAAKSTANQESLAEFGIVPLRSQQAKSQHQLKSAIKDCLSTLLLSDCTRGRDFMKMMRLGNM